MKTVSLVIALRLTGLSVSLALARAVPATRSTPSQETVSEHVILFVLEGVDQQALKAEPMPVLGRLIKDGAVTWSTATTTPPLRLPAMASLLTGLPVDKHSITWNTFEFSRGYPRPPTVFDYLDLSGGRDTLRVQRINFIHLDRGRLGVFVDGAQVTAVTDELLPGDGFIGLVTFGRTTAKFDSLQLLDMVSNRPLSSPEAY